MGLESAILRGVAVGCLHLFRRQSLQGLEPQALDTLVEGDSYAGLRFAWSEVGGMNSKLLLLPISRLLTGVDEFKQRD